MRVGICITHYLHNAYIGSFNEIYFLKLSEAIKNMAAKVFFWYGNRGELVYKIPTTLIFLLPFEVPEVFCFWSDNYLTTFCKKKKNNFCFCFQILLRVFPLPNKKLKTNCCSDFRYESNGIFVLGVGFFFLQTNFDFLTSHFWRNFLVSFESYCCPELEFEKIFLLWSFFVKLWGFKDCHFAQFGTTNARYI